MAWNEIVLCAAAVAAGMINSVAGGGTLLTFPALMEVMRMSRTLGMTRSWPASSPTARHVAMLPGSAVAAWEYRRDFRGGAVVRLAACAQRDRRAGRGTVGHRIAAVDF